MGRSVLPLTTTGRKSGLPRVTSLVYEQQGDSITVASARGHSADWFRNVQANPRVRVRAGPWKNTKDRPLEEHQGQALGRTPRTGKEGRDTKMGEEKT